MLVLSSDTTAFKRWLRRTADDLLRCPHKRMRANLFCWKNVVGLYLQCLRMAHFALFVHGVHVGTGISRVAGGQIPVVLFMASVDSCYVFDANLGSFCRREEWRKWLAVRSLDPVCLACRLCARFQVQDGCALTRQAGGGCRLGGNSGRRCIAKIFEFVDVRDTRKPNVRCWGMHDRFGHGCYRSQIRYICRCLLP